MISKWIAAFTLSPILAMATAIGHAKSSNAHEQCSHQQSAEGAHAAMMDRGEHAMGFSQTTTTHHFLLKPDGGVIAVSANDPKDSASRDQIRMHLRHIAQAFSGGDFDIPMFVHDQTPPGVSVMKRHSHDIRYRFTESQTGGQVTLASHDPEAIQAVHDFLKFQIREHKTGDPGTIDEPVR
jgi:hypothetical protein